MPLTFGLSPEVAGSHRYVRTVGRKIASDFFSCAHSSGFIRLARCAAQRETTMTLARLSVERRSVNCTWHRFPLLAELCISKTCYFRPRYEKGRQQHSYILARFLRPRLRQISIPFCSLIFSVSPFLPSLPLCLSLFLSLPPPPFFFADKSPARIKLRVTGTLCVPRWTYISFWRGIRTSRIKRDIIFTMRCRKSEKSRTVCGIFEFFKFRTLSTSVLSHGCF